MFSEFDMCSTGVSLPKSTNFFSCEYRENVYPFYPSPKFRGNFARYFIIDIEFHPYEKLWETVDRLIKITSNSLTIQIIQWVLCLSNESLEPNNIWSGPNDPLSLQSKHLFQRVAPEKDDTELSQAILARIQELTPPAEELAKLQEQVLHPPPPLDPSLQHGKTGQGK